MCAVFVETNCESCNNVVNSYWKKLSRVSEKTSKTIRLKIEFGIDPEIWISKKDEENVIEVIISFNEISPRTLDFQIPLNPRRNCFEWSYTFSDGSCQPSLLRVSLLETNRRALWIIIARLSELSRKQLAEGANRFLASGETRRVRNKFAVCVVASDEGCRPCQQTTGNAARWPDILFTLETPILCNRWRPRVLANTVVRPPPPPTCFSMFIYSPCLTRSFELEAVFFLRIYGHWLTERLSSPHRQPSAYTISFFSFRPPFFQPSNSIVDSLTIVAFQVGLPKSVTMLLKFKHSSHQMKTTITILNLDIKFHQSLMRRKFCESNRGNK